MQAIGSDAPVRFLITNGLKPDIEGLRMIKCENTNPLPLPESRVWAEYKSPRINHPNEHVHLALAHRLPNLPRTREDKAGGQQGALIIL